MTCLPCLLIAERVVFRKRKILVILKKKKKSSSTKKKKKRSRCISVGLRFLRLKEELFDDSKEQVYICRCFPQ